MTGIGRRCTRNTKAGNRCKLGRISWPGRSEFPDPASCFHHLTDEERALDAEYRIQWAAEWAHLELPRMALIASDPACWSWRAPAAADLAQMTPDARVSGMYAWHQGRCAICGQIAEVTDHDHKTSLVRGRLCHGCNVNEGCSRPRGERDVFARYRERNPASIWDAREVYYDVFAGAYAEPAPVHHPWRDNPMKGIGL